MYPTQLNNKKKAIKIMKPARGLGWERLTEASVSPL
jgi:hypothetical protein